MLSRIAATAAFALLLAQAQPAKRKLTPNDFDSWRSIASQQISNDGTWIAYSVFPQVGNGEVMLRNIQTGKEKRIPAGALPIREVNDPNAEPSELGPQPIRGPALQFTAEQFPPLPTLPVKSGNRRCEKGQKARRRIPQKRNSNRHHGNRCHLHLRSSQEFSTSRNEPENRRLSKGHEGEIPSHSRPPHRPGTHLRGNWRIRTHQRRANSGLHCGREK